MMWRWGQISHNICTNIIATIQYGKHHYSCPILEKETSFYLPSNENSDHYQHYRSQPSPSHYHLQNQESNTIDREEITKKDPFLKRILIVDDDPDITFTFKVGLEEYNYYHEDKRKFEVYAYDNPVLTIREFKPNFYDMLLTDIFMPHMNGYLKKY